ncbi:hypothetical protein BDV40DRAFT_304226 [Aspergillus tamarii]|uniref:Uncharacterized protein n=1 Tax=Aspergillus tamarii TaxID=41984 RepID=A0A5N6UIF2_ASPTM|nr:hypothetical protein BDV40DRAFT_304226 [Aspergillus tamarii]
MLKTGSPDSLYVIGVAQFVPMSPKKCALTVFLSQLVLGLITIAPWATLIIFDLTLYVWRMLTYELPVIGGRARGRQRPRAPSLNERPNGQRRAFVLASYEATGAEKEDNDGLKRG